MPKKSFFKTLPGEGSAHRNIAEHLSTQDIRSLSLVSKDEHTFVGPVLRRREQIDPLLRHVARGEQAQAQVMLHADPSLMFERSSVTELSGRTFPSVSGFEYALWAMDTRMWRMMLECIPETPAGVQMKEILLIQKEKLETEGLSFDLEGQRFEHQHHFDLMPLRLAMQGYADLNELYTPDQFFHVIGHEQGLVPAHLAQEYCCRSYQNAHGFHERTEHDFESLVFERSLELAPDFGVNDERQWSWWPLNDDLSCVIGRDFAVSFVDGYARARLLSNLSELPGQLRVKSEINALDRLFSVRKRELGLIEDLLSPGQEEHPHP